jgi:putative transposase
MKEGRFTEEQIIGGSARAGGRRKNQKGVSAARDLERNKWKVKYGPGGVGRRRLKALEDENRRLKRLLADSPSGNAALNDLLGKNA